MVTTLKVAVSHILCADQLMFPVNIYSELLAKAAVTRQQSFPRLHKLNTPHYYWHWFVLKSLSVKLFFS